MLEGGEDPLFVARRLVVCASEDIGMFLCIYGVCVFVLEMLEGEIDHVFLVRRLVVCASLCMGRGVCICVYIHRCMLEAG